MKKSTKIVHFIVRFFHLENLIISLHPHSKLILKFLPLNNQYSKGTSKNVIRNIAKFRLDISDYMQWYIWANLEDSAWKLAVEHSKINTGDIFDIGTNVGAFTIKTACNLDADTQVHAFEPNPHVFSLLNENMTLNSCKNVILNPIGLGLINSEVWFNWSFQNSGGGRFNQTGSGEKLSITTLDDYVQKSQVTKISFIKIDVEGYEMNVLKGGEQTIKTYRPKMFIELDDNNLKDQGGSAAGLVEMLETWGYAITHSETKSKVTSQCNFKDCHYDIICEIK
jgi:FkbM family methyltransferase